MGWVMMSERDLNRIEVISQIVDGRLTAECAANMLALTKRQIFRLLRRFREDGPSALSHKARGKPPNNKVAVSKRTYAMDLVREKYRDFGPTLAAEVVLDFRPVCSLVKMDQGFI
ncbi:helix-turn-helix domain-containing protein [Halocynthiibacter styelae]|uniref:Helix-turn-helix domain-containing protein n=1 Tax=Halocynthiibacter styelae TaxID=2761955 RepID=A0A8J7J8N6_9RHOB|nr:helix-turn-helix domain-containing protein [Paenihalocynthiibacter styelae]MBI1495450.1 helix-turn-helix domain-containing protein [Paenihalocynthiibacter styelae]